MQGKLQVEIQSGLDSRTYTPAVHLSFFVEGREDVDFMLPVDCARSIAFDILEAAATSITDSVNARFLREDVGMSEEAMRLVLAKSAEFRIKLGIGQHDDEPRIR